VRATVGADPPEWQLVHVVPVLPEEPVLPPELAHAVCGIAPLPSRTAKEKNRIMRYVRAASTILFFFILTSF
jgi:hypothetical protein